MLLLEFILECIILEFVCICELLGCWSVGLFVNGIILGSLKDGLFIADENDEDLFICWFYDNLLFCDILLFYDYFEFFNINDGYLFICVLFGFTMINYGFLLILLLDDKSLFIFPNFADYRLLLSLFFTYKLFLLVSLILLFFILILLNPFELIFNNFFFSSYYEC